MPLYPGPTASPFGKGGIICKEQPCHAGSLLSTHILLVNNPAIMPEYNDCLLRLATELGDRLLPAFNTPHGIPLSWVNLRKVRVVSSRLHTGCTVNFYYVPCSAEV